MPKLLSSAKGWNRSVDQSTHSSPYNGPITPIFPKIHRTLDSFYFHFIHLSVPVGEMFSHFFSIFSQRFFNLMAMEVLEKNQRLILNVSFVTKIFSYL
jgi:hypothetical protein